MCSPHTLKTVHQEVALGLVETSVPRTVNYLPGYLLPCTPDTYLLCCVPDVALEAAAIVPGFVHLWPGIAKWYCVFMSADPDTMSKADGSCL